MGFKINYREAFGIQSTPLIAFLDLEKTFDRVPTEKLWMAMAEYMVPADLQIAIKSKYKTNKSRVSTNIRSGEWFTTESGVRQGSIVSPIWVKFWTSVQMGVMLTEK